MTDRIRHALKTASVALGLAAALAAPAAAQVLYSIADAGTSLFRIDSAGNLSTVPFSGAVDELGGLALRPADNRLYGMGFGGQIVTINPFTGGTTLVSTSSTAPASDVFNLSFNPQADRLRSVEAFAQQNLRIDVDSGTATVDTPVSYAPGDPNAAATPNIVAIAYTNRDTDPATPTQLYYLDDQLDILATTTNPNGGVLTTVGELIESSSGLPIDIDEFTGFDIVNVSGTNVGALLADAGPFGTAFLQVDLATGVSEFGGFLPINGLYGLVVDPDTVVFFVAEPGSLALLLAGLGVTGWTRRRNERRP